MGTAGIYRYVCGLSCHHNTHAVFKCPLIIGTKPEAIETVGHLSYCFAFYKVAVFFFTAVFKNIKKKGHFQWSNHCYISEFYMKSFRWLNSQGVRTHTETRVIM